MITENYKVITPLYGRDYASKAKAEAAFRAGKEFLIQPSDKYCTIRDFAKGVIVEVRYKKLTMLTMVTV